MTSWGRPRDSDEKLLPAVARRRHGESLLANHGVESGNDVEKDDGDGSLAGAGGSGLDGHTSGSDGRIGSGGCVDPVDDITGQGLDRSANVLKFLINGHQCTASFGPAIISGVAGTHPGLALNLLRG